MRAPTLAAALLAVGLSTLPPPARATEGMDHGAARPASAAKARLERLKALAGTWKGTAGHGDQRHDATVTWSVTGGGSAVVETMFGGTPHEMITVYTVDGDDLVLTHYCSAGNQPTMKALPETDPKVIAFDFVRGGNMKPGDMHMHAAVITLAGPDRLVSEWTSWKDGTAAGPPARFELVRQK